MTEAANLARLSAAADETLQKMLDGLKSQLANCERMIELLQPEWDAFEARTGHNTYVARDYADHLSAARRHRKEIAALEEVLSGRLVLLPSVDDLVLLIGDNAEGYAEGRNRWIIVSPDDLATAIHNHLKGTGDA